jgi:hypothetical protein
MSIGVSPVFFRYSSSTTDAASTYVNNVQHIEWIIVSLFHLDISIQTLSQSKHKHTFFLSSARHRRTAVINIHIIPIPSISCNHFTIHSTIAQLITYQNALLAVLLQKSQCTVTWKTVRT